MNKIRKILDKIRPEEDFDNSDNFLEDGLLDSFDIVELISEIESEFDIVVDDMTVTEEYFSSIEQLEKFVQINGGIL